MNLDAAIIAFDRGLRTVFGRPQAARPVPGESLPDAPLSEEERRLAAALMRVNHCGEVCAQALYQGQALASSDPHIKEALSQAAREEEDHLAWCEQRIKELGGRTSLLNPLWFSGALAIGYVAGRFGDEWNLGFLKETEKQVERHLLGHLERLSPQDQKTRAIVDQMKIDEAQHAHTAEMLGARELPAPVKLAMKLSAKVMTSVAHYV
ncbi:MAG: 2-polyprenyl-3-methyl-6-methoxy-1,4-benzoquinone monooxygenase [Pseudomonadota bacterium]|nr:MAG: demethoxyubiquinone hydroxylase family protein [Pseudomonadota bacterium]